MRIMLMFGLLLSPPLWASMPGEALDCSDWVFNEPGYSCTVVVPRPCESNSFCGSVVDDYGVRRAVDSTGRSLMVRSVFNGTCLRVSTETAMRRIEVVALSGDQESILGSIEERCVSGTPYNRIDTIGQVPSSGSVGVTTDYAAVFTISHSLGRLELMLQSSCFGVGGNCPSDYGSGRFILGIDGFATTFDILQTFAPTADAVGFRVPYMPEGLQYADYFDTYYGSLATVGDWSQAQPLQCGYPATAPSVGDYLTVDDTQPDPGPGQGYYYLTAANYQGQRRFGRRSSGGALAGRDVAALPECIETRQFR